MAKCLAAFDSAENNGGFVTGGQGLLFLTCADQEFVMLVVAHSASGVITSVTGGVGLTWQTALQHPCGSGVGFVEVWTAYSSATQATEQITMNFPSAGAYAVASNAVEMTWPDAVVAIQAFDQDFGNASGPQTWTGTLGGADPQGLLFGFPVWVGNFLQAPISVQVGTGYTETVAEQGGGDTVAVLLGEVSNAIGTGTTTSFVRFGNDSGGLPYPNTGTLVVVSIGSNQVSDFAFSASGLTCSNRLTTLTWTTDNAASVSISPRVGAVAGSGSTTLYVNQTTTFTITATDACGGLYTQTATVTVPSSMVILPWVAGKQSYYFNAGGSYAAGVYLITCCGGAFTWNGTAIGVNSNDRKAETSQAFKVIGSQGLTMDTPGHYVGYGSLAASDSANNGLTQIYNHAGGPIGVYLALDDYSGVGNEIENPGFSIAGPAPTVYMIGHSSPAIAGTGIPLTFAVAGNTDAGGISIDQGVGVVSSSGSITVSPTVTTRYTLTATYAGLTVSTYVDVLIGTPSVPVVLVYPSCGGTIVIGWTAPAFTTSTLIERSSSPTSGFTQVASVAFGTLSYTDTPPTQGLPYYYRMRNTDGTNFSQYTLIMETATLVPPAAVTNLTVTAPLGTPLLSWTASPGAVTYLVQWGTSPGGETTVYTLRVVSPGQVFAGVRDPQAPSGVLCYYRVVGVNACGDSVASNEVSVVAGVSTAAYY